MMINGMMINGLMYLVLARYSSPACRTEYSTSSPVTSFTSLEEFGRLHSVIGSNKPSKSHSGRTLRLYAHRAEPLFRVFTPIEALRWVLFVRNIDARGWELQLRDPESSGNQTKYVSYGGSFLKACKARELDIVRLWWRERENACGSGWRRGMSMVHHCTVQQTTVTSLRCSTCASRVLTRRRGLSMTGHHCPGHQRMTISLWYATLKAKHSDVARAIRRVN